jgi:hypothetical protein
MISSTIATSTIRWTRPLTILNPSQSMAQSTISAIPMVTSPRMASRLHEYVCPRGCADQVPFQNTRSCRSRLALITVVAVSLAACASSGRGSTAPPDVFDQEYEYSGIIEGNSVSGVFTFFGHPVYAAEYEFTREGRICRAYVNSLTAARVQIGCQGLFFEFIRSGRIMQMAPATLRGTREVERRECAEWTVDPRTGQRVCARWQTVRVPVAVTFRGYVTVRRVGGG